MFDGDGAEEIEMQALQIAQGATQYRGSAPCPQCGVIMNPVEYMMAKGVCNSCENTRLAKRVARRMA
jgi:hypothetical protein